MPDVRDDVKAVRAACPHCKTEAEYLIDDEAYETYVAMKRQFPDIEMGCPALVRGGRAPSH